MTSSYADWKLEIEEGNVKSIDQIRDFVLNDSLNQSVPTDLVPRIITLFLSSSSVSATPTVQSVDWNTSEKLSVDSEEQELIDETEELECKEDVRAVIRRLCLTKSSPYNKNLVTLANTLASSLSNNNSSSDLKSDLYHTLDAIIDNYCPFVFNRGNLEISCFNKLLRLVLQYHDPELALHFDKNRRASDDYILPWLNTLFTKQFAPQNGNILDLWILLFAHNTPAIVCLFGLALVISHRDELLKLNQPELNPESITSILATVPNQQDERTYMRELYAKTIQLRDETPLSARDQIKSVMLSTGVANVQLLNDALSESVVLPVPTSEIVEAFKRKPSASRITPVRYIIIDCRSVKSFRFARLPTAVHIGEHVGYDKQKMQAILDRFVAAKGSHFTIFGTGRQIREEDNLLKVIAMRFVAHGFEHISIATGGFKDTIKYISSDEIEYVRDENLQSDRGAQSQEEWSAELISTKISSLFTWGKKVAEDYIQENERQAHELSQQQHKQPQLSKTSDAKSKPFTPEPPKSAFSLDDEEFDDYHLNEDIDENEKVIKLEDLKKLDESVTIFTASLESTKRSGQEQITSPASDVLLQEKRYIAIGRNIILSIKPHPTKLGYGIIVWKRTLRQLLKLSFSRENPTKISLHVKGYPNTLSYTTSKASHDIQSPSFSDSYIIQQSKEMIKVIQDNISLLKQQHQKQQ